MRKDFLHLTPKRYLCPYCGEWHDWENHELKFCDSNISLFRNKCAFGSPCAMNTTDYRVFFQDGYCYYSIKRWCEKARLDLDGKIAIASITESIDKPIVTFKVPFKPYKSIGSNICSHCGFYQACNLVRLADTDDKQDMEITLGFEFEESIYDKLIKSNSSPRKEYELQERENALKCKEQSLQDRENALKCKEQSLQDRENALKCKEQSLQDRENALKCKEQSLQDREYALKCKEQSSQDCESALRIRELEHHQRQAEQPAHQEIKEDPTMANNIFNMNMEFGPNNDKNIASTLMGIAVKNGDSWRIYDKKKKSITDVGRMKLGNLPLFILPTTKLNEGDLIKDSGEYYFVMKVEKESTQTMCAKTGEIQTVIPIKNVLGFSCYSKVIALSDSINMGCDFNVKKLAILSIMCRQNDECGGQMSQLLPLMLFKDKLGEDDDMMKMMLMTSMMSVPAEDSNQNTTMNQLLPLTLLKEKDIGDDDMMKMFLMSSMMSGNMAGNNNPFTDYLMLDMLTDKEKNEKAHQPALNSSETVPEEEPT